MSRYQKTAGLRFGMALLIASGALATVGCFPRTDGPQQGKVGQEEVDEVLAVMVKSKEIPLVHSTTGEIVPSNSIKLNASANGTIGSVLVREGQRISGGTQVIRFENTLVSAKLDFVRAEAEEADAAIDFEQNRLENRDTLLDEEEISAAVYDLIDKHLEYEKARSKRAKTEIAYLEKVAENIEVKSPIAGVVLNRSVEDGMPVTEGQFLMEVIQDDPVKLRVPLPEEFIPATYRGQLLQVNLPGVEQAATVKITEVGVAVDPLTRTFDVFCKLDNSEGQLKTGMNFPVTLSTDKKTKKLAIPKSAVALRDKKTVVFSIENGVAKQLRVKLGRASGDEVAVQKGVEEGTIIIVDPPKTLKHGNKVEIRTAVAPPE